MKIDNEKKINKGILTGSFNMKWEKGKMITDCLCINNDDYFRLRNTLNDLPLNNFLPFMFHT